MQPGSDTRITLTRSFEPGEVTGLYASAQWGSADDYDHSRVRRALDNTSLVLAATTIDRKLVGMARVFFDPVDLAGRERVD